MSQTSARPAQVTVAGWVVVIASIVVVVSVFDQLGSIASVETRESVQRFLAEPPGEGLGLGVDAVIGILRASAYLAAACAAASAILGWYVLRRDRVARLVLTVLAVPLFLTGLASGGFFPAVVAGSTLLLWAQPAREWFRDGPGGPSSTQGFRDGPGRAPSASSADSAPPASSAPPVPSGLASPTSAPDSSAPDQPRAWAGWGDPAARSPASPPSEWRPGDSRTQLLTGRPEPILWSCLLTWAFSGIAVVGLLLSAVLLAGDGTDVIAEARTQAAGMSSIEVSDQMLLAGVLAVVVGFLVWSLVAIGLAVLVWRGKDWARITLAVSAGLAAAVALLSLIGGQVYAVPLVIGCVVATRMLLSRRAAEWCRQPRGRSSRPGP